MVWECRGAIRDRARRNPVKPCDTCVCGTFQCVTKIEHSCFQIWVCYPCYPVADFLISPVRPIHHPHKVDAADIVGLFLLHANKRISSGCIHLTGFDGKALRVRIIEEAIKFRVIHDCQRGFEDCHSSAFHGYFKFGVDGGWSRQDLDLLTKVANTSVLW